MVDRTLVRIAGSVSIAGGIAFWVANLPLIAGYLCLSGVVLWVFTLGWHARYQSVLSQAPDGFQITGETYPNPPTGQLVDVWQRGIRRVYVRHDLPETESRSED